MMLRMIKATIPAAVLAVLHFTMIPRLCSGNDVQDEQRRQEPRGRRRRFLVENEEIRNNDLVDSPLDVNWVDKIVDKAPAVLDFDLFNASVTDGEPVPPMAERDANGNCPENSWCDDAGLDNSMWAQYRGNNFATDCVNIAVCGKNPDRAIQMSIWKGYINPSSLPTLELIAADANDLYFKGLELDVLDPFGIQMDGVNGADEFGHFVITNCDDNPYDYCPTETFLRPRHEAIDAALPIPTRISNETLPFNISYNLTYARKSAESVEMTSILDKDSNYELMSDSTERPCPPGKWCDQGWDAGLWFELSYTEGDSSLCVQIVTCEDKDLQLIGVSGKKNHNLLFYSLTVADDDGGRLPNTPRLEFKPPSNTDVLLLGVDGFEGTKSAGYLVLASCEDENPYRQCPANQSCADRGPAETTLKLATKAGQHEISGRLTAQTPSLSKCEDEDSPPKPGLVYSVQGNGKPITVTTCDLGVKPSFRIDLSVMQCNAASGADDCVEVTKQGRCGHGMHVTFDTVKGETYDVLVRAGNEAGEGKFAIQAFQLGTPSKKNIKNCAASLEATCAGIGCPNWSRCKIKKIAATCSHSNECNAKCKEWWACTREEARTGCDEMSPELSVRLEEAKAARNVVIEKVNKKCGSNIPTLT